MKNFSHLFGSLASPSRDNPAGLLYASASFWSLPWPLILAAMFGIGLFVWWYCKHHIVIYVLNQEKSKKYKKQKNNNKNVSFSMPYGYGSVMTMGLLSMSTINNVIKFTLSRKKSALVALFLGIVLLSDFDFNFKTQHSVVELGSTPPSSLPLGLPPPPIDISKEVTLVEASPKYEEVDTRTPKARGASFLKDKTFCLLSGATTQSYFGPVHTRTKQGDCIVHVGTPEVLLPTFGSRFQLDGFEGYQTTKDFSGRIRGLFQYLPLFLKRKTPSFVNGQLDGDPAISMSTQTKVRIGSVGNMDVGELKPNTEYEHPVDENGCGQNLGGLTKWINHFTCDGFCMKVSESSGDRVLEGDVGSLLGSSHTKKAILSKASSDEKKKSASFDEKLRAKLDGNRLAMVVSYLLVAIVLLILPRHIGQYLTTMQKLLRKSSPFVFLDRVDTAIVKGKHVRISQKRWLTCLASCIFFMVAFVAALDTDQADIEKQKFNEFDRMKELNSRLLRGIISSEAAINDEAPAPNMILELNDMTASQLATVDKMLESYQNGDDETLGKLILDNYGLLKQFSQETGDVSPDIPASALVQMFDYDMVSAAAEQLHLVSRTKDTAVTLHSVRRHAQEDKEDDFERHRTSDFNFGYDGSYDHSSFNNFQSKFLDSKVLKDMEKMLQKAHKHGRYKIPSHLKTRLMGRKGTSTHREQRRRHLEQDETCLRSCSNDDTECVCARLRECVGRLEPYDFAVLFAGKGFIYSDGTFAADEVQVFDAYRGLTAKIERIQTLANDDGDCSKLLEEFHTSCQEDSCSSTNKESYQLTVDQVCDAINEPTLLRIEEIAKTYDSFFLSGGGPFLDDNFETKIMDWYIRQKADVFSCGFIDGKSVSNICQADWLDSLVGDDGVFYECKLSCQNKMNEKLAEIETEWRASLSPASCNPTSFEVCGEFVSKFDEFYETADQMKYPYGYENPLRKDQTQAIHNSTSSTFAESLERTRFPTAYNFTYSEQGVRSLIPGEYSYANLYDSINEEEFPSQTVANSTGSWTPKQGGKHWVRGGAFQPYMPADKFVSDSEVHPFKCCSNVRTGPNWVESTRTITAWKVRVQLKNKNYLHMREVQVIDINGINVARGQPATQSSNEREDRTADKAVNGIIGGWDDRQTTNYEQGAYWEVNLGGWKSIKEVRIFNRVSGQDRLSNSVVSLRTDDDVVIAQYEFGNVNWNQFFIPITDFALVAYRVVIQLPSDATEFLHMREVEVIDMNGINVARDKPATQSSTPWGDKPAGKAVDGVIWGVNAGRGTYEADSNRQSTGNGKSEYWIVDLGHDVTVTEVRIFNRLNAQNRLSGATVSLRNVNNQDLATFIFGDVKWDEFTIPINSFTVSPGSLWFNLVEGTPGSMCTNKVLNIEKFEKCPSGTFDEAGKFCKDHGARVCSSMEIHSNCARLGDKDECNYDRRLLWAGFSYEYTANTTCPTSQNNVELAMKAAKTCDETMKLLVGSDTSVGAVSNLAMIVNDPNATEDPSELIPGYWKKSLVLTEVTISLLSSTTLFGTASSSCMDNALDSSHFGSNYDPESDKNMTCRDFGLYHLGISPEACENASGKWFPNPCHTLKKCIKNRPTVEPGHCFYNETISCREDSQCADIPIPGSCVNLDTGSLLADVNCTSEDLSTCPDGFECRLLDNEESRCDYNPPAFEEWAASFTIEDASNQTQCEAAREELGFDKDDRDDALICEQFNEYKCDDESIFDDLDILTSDRPQPPVLVSFSPTRFTPAPIEGKTLDFLNLKDWVSQGKKGDSTSTEVLEREQFHLNKLYETTNYWNEKLKKALNVGCEVLYLVLFGNSSPLYVPCRWTEWKIVAALDWLSYGIKVRLLYIEQKILEIGFNNPSWDEELYKLSFERFEWTVDSLGKINTNIGEQHQGIIEQLTEQHQEVQTSLGDFMECSTNHLGIQTLQATCCSYESGTKTCTCKVVPSLSVECCETLGLDRDEFCKDGRRSLKEENGGTHLTELNVEYFSGNQPVYQNIDEIIDKEEIIIENEVEILGRLEEVVEKEDEIIMKEGNIMAELDKIEDKEEEIIKNELEILTQLVKVIDTEKAIIQKEDAIIAREVDIQDTLNEMDGKLDGILLKLDLDPINVQPNTKSKKSKKAKQGGKDALFHRALLIDNKSVSGDNMSDTVEAKEKDIAVIIEEVGATKGKVGSIEVQVKSIDDRVESMEVKIESMEGKVESMEGKVDKIEKTMEEMKQMLSQLMTRGIADA